MHSRSLSIVASTLVLSLALALHAQNPPVFTPGQQVAVPAGSAIFLSADFDNDGFADVLTGQGPFDNITLVVFLNNGDGTYRGPFPVQGVQNPEAVAFGDFNQDGNLDLAVTHTTGNPAGTGNGTVTIFFGDGHGNFGSPQNYNVVGQPSGIAAGDFNNDGLMDLAVSGFNSKSVTILTNTGGAFSTSSFTVPTFFDTTGLSDVLTGLVAGDFNGDGKMDLVYQDSCGSCDVSQERYFLLTNTGGSFAPTLLSQGSTGAETLHSADLDGDGFADFYFAFEGCHTPCQGLTVFYSNGDGTFTLSDMLTGDSAMNNGGNPVDVVAGDFNNDGVMDLAAAVFSSFRVSTPGLDIYLGKGGRSGFSTAFHFDSPNGSSPFRIAAGFVDGDGSKDILLGGNGSFVPFFNNSSLSQDPCPYPASPGLNFCLPSDGSNVSSPVHIVGSFHAQTQPANRIELWIDGNKMFQVFNDRIDTMVPLSAGTHEATLVGVSATGQFIKSTNSFTVGGVSCPVPGSPGVSICTPAPDSTVNSPVHVSASAAPNPGVVITAMRIYIDNQEAKTVTGNTISGDLTLPSGNHFLAVVAWDNTGGSYISTENITVHGSSAPCLPQSAGMRICTPAPGATVSSPVEVAAGAVPSSGRITAIRVYVDDVAVYLNSNNTSSPSFAIDAGITMAAGQHHLVVVGYQDDGSAQFAGEMITVP